MASNEGRYNPVLITGVLAILIGGLVMLDHAGYLHVGNLWRFWPLLLIVAGVVVVMLPAGTLVEIEGVTVPGKFAPFVVGRDSDEVIPFLRESPRYLP